MPISLIAPEPLTMSDSSVPHDEAAARSTVSRRDFLRVGGLSFAGLSVAEQAAAAHSRMLADHRSCILILMTGGPSPFETFDPKPTAVAEIRGPLKSISTAVPGVAFSETLPGLATRLDRFAVIRSLYHTAAPIHETGLQLLQTGRLARGNVRPPSFASVIARHLGPRDGVAPYVVLPRLLGNTGVNMYRGQTAGSMGRQFDPLTNGDAQAAVLNGDESNFESAAMKRQYGDNRFGRLCWQARHLVECGVRCVTLNLFDRLRGEVTWDCHGRTGSSPSTLFDYRDTLGPQFDRAVSALLDDLADRGILDDTLIVAAGEFGRTPRINVHGGRDHWPGVFSALVAGGGVQGGRIIGASDARGTAPQDRPVTPAELVASLYHGLGMTPHDVQEATAVTCVDAEDAESPIISELFAGHSV